MQRILSEGVSKSVTILQVVNEIDSINTGKSSQLDKLGFVHYPKLVEHVTIVKTSYFNTDFL